MDFKRLLLALLILGAMAFGQAGRYDNISIGLTANNLYTVTPNASVQLYVYPGPTTNCAGGGCTLATTFTSQTAGSSCGTSSPLTRPGSTSCVGTVDAGGNYGFWAESGKYQACITAAGFGTNCTNIEVTSNYTTVPGVYTNTQPNQNFLVLVGGIANNQFQPPGFFATEGGTFGVAVPNGAGIHEADGVVGMVTTACDSGVRTHCNAVAVDGHAQAQANNAAVWGINTTTFNTDNTLTGLNIIGAEHDIGGNGNQSGGYIHGVDIFLSNNGPTTMPSNLLNAVGLTIGNSAPSNGLWGEGMWIQGIGINPSGNAIYADQLCATGGGACNSPRITVVGQDAGNVQHLASLYADSKGSAMMTPIGAAGTAATITGTGACATHDTQIGGSWSGNFRCTGTTGAATITITPGITAPVGWSCYGADNTAGHELVGAQSNVTTTTCTLKFSSVTNNDFISFSTNSF